MSNKKGRINIVYSTNPDFNYQYEEQEEQATLPPEKQNLRVTLDSKQRAVRIVTLIDGFIGTEMWRRRFRKRRANYHPRGIQRQNTRNPARQQLPRTLKQ